MALSERHAPFEVEPAFSPVAFLRGLGFVAAFYLLAFGYAALVGERTLAGLQGRLASHAGAVEHQAGAVENAASLAPFAPSVPPPSTAPGEKRPADAANAASGESSAKQKPFSLLPSSKALPAAPAEGLSEPSAHGALPVAGRNGQTPFSAYKKPALINRGQPVLAVAVTDYGLSDSLSETVLETLPADVSLILNPYAAQADLWQKRARKNGHETWLQLFTLTRSFPFRDPGAKGLLPDASLKHNRERLYWALGRTAGYAGIAAYTDSAMSAGAPMFKTLSAEMFRRGLGYIEINPGRDSFLAPAAVAEQAPNAQAAFSLDASGAAFPDTSHIEKHLRDHGGALVIVRATPGNVRFLGPWLERMQARGFNLVPASALAEIGREG